MLVAAQWLDELREYDIDIHYCKGRLKNIITPYGVEVNANHAQPMSETKEIVLQIASAYLLVFDLFHGLWV